MQHYENPELPGDLTVATAHIQRKPFTEQERLKKMEDERTRVWKHYTTRSDGRPRFDDKASAQFLKDNRYKMYLEKCAFGSEQDKKWTADDEARMFAHATGE